MTSDPNATPGTPGVLIISKGLIGALLGFLLLQNGILVRVVQIDSDGEDSLKIHLNEHAFDLLHLFGGGIAQSIQATSVSPAQSGTRTEIGTRDMRKTIAEIFPTFSGEYYHLDEAAMSGQELERAAYGPNGTSPSPEYDWVIWTHVPEGSEEVNRWMGTSASTSQTKPKLLTLHGRPDHKTENFETLLQKSLDLSWKFTLVNTGVSPESLLDGYLLDPTSLSSSDAPNLTSGHDGSQKSATRAVLEKLGFVPPTKPRKGNDEYPAWSRFTARHTIFITLPNSNDSGQTAELKDTLLSLPRGPYVRVIVVRPTQASSGIKWQDVVEVGGECADGSGEVWELQAGNGEVYKALYTGGNQVEGISMSVVTPDARLLSFRGLEEMKGYLGSVFPWHFGSESGEV